MLLLFISIFFAFISYHITSWIYDWLGKHPQGFWLQLWTVVGFCALCLFSHHHFLIGLKRQRNYWNTIVDALSRIAKGDFTVKLDLKTDEDQFGQLIHGINHMAVELGEMEKCVKNLSRMYLMKFSRL